MREQRRRSVSLVCVFVIVLVAIAVAVCAGAAAPARAAFAPHGIWWEIFGEAPNADTWVDVAKGPNGALYAAGNYNVGGATGDLLVAKFSRNDDAMTGLVWQHSWDNPAEHLVDQASALAVDHSGAVIVAGSTDTAAHGWEWVVAKWDINGAPLWQKTFAASPLTAWNAFAYDVACDAAGNIYVCGVSQTNTHLGHTVAALVVRKLGSSDGHLIWQRFYGGFANSSNQGTHLALDTAGNAYCTGYGQNAHGDSDIVTVKYRAGDGHTLWVRRLAGASHRDDEGTGILVHGTHVWVTGGVYKSASNRAVALARYTLAGKQLWLHSWIERANTREYAYALAVDAQGNAVVVGAGNDNPVTRDHAFILRWSAAGVLKWQRISYNSVSHKAEWRDVVCDAAGRIWVGGYAVSGGSDSFEVARYTSVGARSWRSAWKGYDGLGAECRALCFGKTGLFTAGTIRTTIGGLDAGAIKYTK